MIFSQPGTLYIKISFFKKLFGIVTMKKGWHMVRLRKKVSTQDNKILTYWEYDVV